MYDGALVLVGSVGACEGRGNVGEAIGRHQFCGFGRYYMN
jgi:hypothetical protein